MSDIGWEIFPSVEYARNEVKGVTPVSRFFSGILRPMNAEFPPCLLIHSDVAPAPEEQRDIQKERDTECHPEPQILPCSRDRG